MGDLFRQVLQMSIYGSIAIIAVLILRRCFHNLPKRITCVFWLIPGFRLLCPLNIGTAFSVMNIARLPDGSGETINHVANAVSTADPVMPDPSWSIQDPVVKTSAVSDGLQPDPWTVVALVWLAGMIVILTYLTVKTVRMMRILKTARISRSGRYYVSDTVDTSFVLGVFRPRIYMQSGLTKREGAYILQHERMHIRNLDHITRIVGVLTACLHWFNPLVWLAFAKLCADLEMRCDEAVIDRMGNKIKKDYCRSIVMHACDRGEIQNVVYAAFAGDDHNGREIKMRINNLAGYKRVSKIVAMAVIVFAMGLTVVLSTKAQNKDDGNTRGEETQYTGEEANTLAIVEPLPAESEPEAVAPAYDDSCPEAIQEDITENPEQEEALIPDDVVYSDEGRPFSETYDYRETPVLDQMAAILENDGFEIQDPDTEYLDQNGNVRTGRELYTFNAYREDDRGIMQISVTMVSEDTARGLFDEISRKGDVWYVEAGDQGGGSWHVCRIYDPRSGVMMDAGGNYVWDWEAMGLFD